MALLTSMQSQLEQGQVPLIRKLLQDNAECIQKIRQQEGRISEQAEVIAHMREQLEAHQLQLEKVNRYLEEIEKKRLKEEEEAKKKRELGDSIVLDNSDKRDKVRQFMDDERKVREFRLAYRASRDGYQSTDFHRKCDNIGATLSLIKTTGGKTIGGYSKASWDQLGSYKQDTTFLFSYDLNQKYLPKTSQISTYHDVSSYGIYFGVNAELITGNGCNGNVNQTTQNGTYGLPPPLQMTGSNNTAFACAEFEVYEVIFE